MSFKFSVPTSSGVRDFLIEKGNSMIFVGANGGGKTRLAVAIEEQISDNCHRISAHRALNLKTDIPKIKQDESLRLLRYGFGAPGATTQARAGQRWRNKPATHLLDDYNFIIQALFADLSNIAVKAHLGGSDGRKDLIESKLEVLRKIWERLLPHRLLEITGDDLKVRTSHDALPYAASDMSDGERSIFYMIGQVLLVKGGSLLVIDEPELHIHKSIMSKLWDELEAARPDCAFIFITHDLEFASARDGDKYIIREYEPNRGWEIDDVPDNTGFNEEITTLILGSRRPILFVEGEVSGLDSAVYRCVFQNAVILSSGSCSQVIHSVASMRNNPSLTRVTCSGIVDGDSRTQDEIQDLESKSIFVLPVSEIENLLLLPNVSKAILEEDGFSEPEVSERMDLLKREIFATLQNEVALKKVVLRYCRRQIDTNMKKIDLSGLNTIDEMKIAIQSRVEDTNLTKIYDDFKATIEAAIAAQDLEKLLVIYDNKALLAIAAEHLGTRNVKNFRNWIIRKLGSLKENRIQEAIKSVIPEITYE